MKLVFFIFLLITSSVSIAQIYDGDSRKILGNSLLPGPLGRSQVASMMVVENNSPGDFKLQTTPLKKLNNVCPDERFADLPAIDASTGSGCLIASDVVITAGHVIEDDADCKKKSFIFGVTSESSKKPFVDDKKYDCDKLLFRKRDQLNGIDVAIIKLNRPVEGIAPVNWRRSGNIKSGDDLYAIGAPQGLPSVYSEGKVAYIFPDGEPKLVGTTVDASRGSSGSCIFNKESGVLEGILSTGESGEGLIKDKEQKCRRWRHLTKNGTPDTKRIIFYPTVGRVGMSPVHLFSRELERFGRPSLKKDKTLSTSPYVQ